MKILKPVRILVVNGALLLGLLAVLVVYLVVTSDLPDQVYSEEQRAFLAYNGLRSVSQEAPTLNVVLSSVDTEDDIAPMVILPVQESHVWARLIARYEERGGVSVTVYDLDFRGEYTLLYEGSEPTVTVALFFPFPDNLETLHDVRFLVDGAEPPGAQYTTAGMSWQAELQTGEAHQIRISYKADGANSFTYGLHRDRRSDIAVTIEVVGLIGSEVPQAALASSSSEPIEGGEAFAWNYEGLIANRDIQLELPARLSFAQRVAQLQDDFEVLAGVAPFLVALFLACLAGLLHLNGMRLSLTGYLLSGCGLALFYPLLTFLSGLVGAVLAAIAAFLLVSGLVMVFLGLLVGWRRTWWRAGLLLLVFLGLFSLGLLTPWRGLLLTGGGLLLVGTFMVVFARRPPAPEPSVPAPAAALVDEPGPAPAPLKREPEPAQRHCPRCGRALASDHGFCPGCGYDIRPLRRCASCGREQFLPAALESPHCVRCGQLLEPK